jgi:hypothetical protein
MCVSYIVSIADYYFPVYNIIYNKFPLDETLKISDNLFRFMNHIFFVNKGVLLRVKIRRDAFTMFEALINPARY